MYSGSYYRRSARSRRRPHLPSGSAVGAGWPIGVRPGRAHPTELIRTPARGNSGLVDRPADLLPAPLTRLFFPRARSRTAWWGEPVPPPSRPLPMAIRNVHDPGHLHLCRGCLRPDWRAPGGVRQRPQADPRAGGGGGRPPSAARQVNALGPPNYLVLSDFCQTATNSL